MPKCVKCERVFHVTQLESGWCEKCRAPKPAEAAGTSAKAGDLLCGDLAAALTLISEQLAAILAELKLLNAVIREKVS